MRTYMIRPGGVGIDLRGYYAKVTNNTPVPK